MKNDTRSSLVTVISDFDRGFRQIFLCPIARAIHASHPATYLAPESNLLKDICHSIWKKSR